MRRAARIRRAEHHGDLQRHRGRDGAVADPPRSSHLQCVGRSAVHYNASVSLPWPTAGVASRSRSPRGPRCTTAAPPRRAPSRRLRAARRLARWPRRAHRRTRAAVQLIDNFTAGAAVEGSDAAVAVALNAQQFTPSAAPYRYLADAHVRAVFPVGRPTAGGTYVNVSVVSPSDLDGATSVTCRFGARSTDAAWEAAGPVPYVACRSPPAVAAGQVQLVVDLVHGGHALTFGSGVPYSYGTFRGAARAQRRAVERHRSSSALASSLGWARAAAGDNVTDAVVELHTGVLLCGDPRRAAVDAARGRSAVPPTAWVAGATSPTSIPRARPSRATTDGKVAAAGQLESTWCRTCCRCRRRAARAHRHRLGDSFTSAFRNQCCWGGAVTNITWLSTPGTVVEAARAHRRATLCACRGDANDVIRTLGRFVSSRIDARRRGSSALGTWQEKVVQPLNGYVMVRVWGSGFVGGTTTLPHPGRPR